MALSVDQINQRLASDPAYQQLFQQLQVAERAGPPSKNPAALTAYRTIVQYLEQNGLQPPDGYTPFSANGQLVQKPQTTWKDIAFALSPVAIGLGLGAAGVGGGFGGGAGATTGSASTLEGLAAGPGAASAPAGAVPLGGIENAAFGLPAGSAAALPGATAAPVLGDLTSVYGTIPEATGTVAGNITSASQLNSSNPIASFFSGLGKSGIAAPLIGGAFQLGGAAIAANGTKDAAQIQADTAAKAIQAQQQLYQQQRADLAPYRSVGGGAIGKLGSLWGVTPAKDASIPGNPYGSGTPGVGGSSSLDPNGKTMPNGVATGTGAQFNPPTLGSMGGASTPAPQAQAAGMVKVKAPTGQTYLVPQAQLGDALAHGGQQVYG